MSDPYDEERRHVVAGMLSTTQWTPAEVNPGNMLPLADRVIRYVEQTIPSSAAEMGEARIPDKDQPSTDLRAGERRRPQ